MPDEEEQRGVNTKEGETCAKLRFIVPIEEVHTWLRDHKVVHSGEVGIHGARTGPFRLLATATRAETLID